MINFVVEKILKAEENAHGGHHEATAHEDHATVEAHATTEAHAAEAHAHHEALATETAHADSISTLPLKIAIRDAIRTGTA